MEGWMESVEPVDGGVEPARGRSGGARRRRGQDLTSLPPNVDATTLRISWREASARRLERQFLANSPAGGPRSPANVVADVVEDVVAAMLGAHAQVPSAAEVAIGVRAAGVTRKDVRAALWEERSLVRTHGPRGTVHLLPADELPLWSAA